MSGAQYSARAQATEAHWLVSPLAVKTGQITLPVSLHLWHPCPVEQALSRQMRHVRLVEGRVSSWLYPHQCRASERPSKDDWERLSMAVSIRRMTLGSGYKYLMCSVAQSDGVSQHASVLTRYYAEPGTPPGRFIDQVITGLGNGIGIEPGTQVTEEPFFRMLGMVQDPLTGEQLGRPPCAQTAPYAERVSTRISAETSGLKGDERDAVVLKIKAEERIVEVKIARAVAGFDLTLSTPKSVSVSWALADGGTQAVIYAAHQQALAYVVGYAEQ